MFTLSTEVDRLGLDDLGQMDGLPEDTRFALAAIKESSATGLLIGNEGRFSVG